MKKLTVLVVIMLVAGLLAGCWLFPEQSLLDKIEADPNPVILTVGDTKQLEITAYYEDGTSADVTSDCDYSIPWLDLEFATVDREGLVTAIEEGHHNSCIRVTYCQENDFTNQRERKILVKVTVTND